jgi:muramoyltetrapeptide carboxypeptidase
MTCKFRAEEDIEMQKPEKLKIGDTIAIVNVAAPEPVKFPDQLDSGIAKLRSLGYKIVEAPHLRKQIGFASDRPAQVASEINELWANDNVSGIFCAGGGIISHTLLENLDFELFSKRPKVFMGSSNPTTLLNAITATSNIPTFHGPSVIWDFGSASQPLETVENFTGALVAGNRLIGRIPDFICPGEASGCAYGGNLTSLMFLAGTKWLPNLAGTILFIEEIGESSQRVYAKLIQLRQMGVLSSIAGLVVGELVECDAEDGVEVRSVVQQVCSPFRFPVGFGLPFGHTEKKVILPIGCRISINSRDGKVELLEGAFV